MPGGVAGVPPIREAPYADLENPGGRGEEDVKCRLNRRTSFRESHPCHRLSPRDPGQTV